MARFIKQTFGDEPVTKIALFADSVLGAWSWWDRHESAFFDIIKYYKDNGFNIEMKDFSVNGGGHYSSRADDYVIEDWMNEFSDPDVRFEDRAIEAAIAWGATHAFVLYHTREATQDSVNANPLGLNIYGEETIVLIQNYIDKFTAAGMDTIVNNTNASPTATNFQDKFTPLSTAIMDYGDSNNWNYIDTYNIMTDPLTGLGRPSEYMDDVHWTRGASSGHERWMNAVIPYINTQYSLTR